MSDVLNAPITSGNAPTEPADSWTTGLDEELAGHIANRGWNKLSAKDAAVEAVKAHRSAEGLLRTPKERLLVLPREDDEAGAVDFWKRLGAPEKPEEYDFSGMAWEDDGKTQRFSDAFRKTAVELRIPKTMAERMVNTFREFAEAETTNGEAAIAAQHAAEERELYKDWGEPNTPTFRSNYFLVDKAMETLGMSKEVGDAIRSQIGLAKFAQMMHKVGTALGEDRFVTIDPASTGVRQPMTRNQAVARLNDLKTDKDWGKRLLSGDKVAKQEFEDLTRLAAGR